MSYPQLYRNTTVGATLQETLDEMIQVRSDDERASERQKRNDDSVVFSKDY